MDRVERHFDDRDRMFPAADLLRLVARYKADRDYKHLLPWMLRVETALEFMVDLDADIADAEDPDVREAAVRGALRNVQGFRQLLDAFDPFLADAPEVFEDVLEATDAAFAKRVRELQSLARRAPSNHMPPAQLAESGFIQRMHARFHEACNRYVEWREEPPPMTDHPLNFFRKQENDDAGKKP